MKHLIIISIILVVSLFSCHSSNMNAKEKLVGTWQGIYKDYSYVLKINDQLEYKLTLKEINITSLEGLFLYKGDEKFGNIKMGEGDEYYIQIKGSKLYIIPVEEKVTIPVVCWVEFHKKK